MLRVVNAGKDLEARRLAVSVSILAGFPLSDIPAAGVSVVCYGDDAETVRALAQQLGDQIQREREQFVFYPEQEEASLDEAVAAVAERKGSYVALLDHADNVMSGGDASSVAALQHLLRRGKPLAPFLVGPIFDSGFAATAKAIGQAVEWRPRNGEMTIKAVVKSISEDGKFVVTGFEREEIDLCEKFHLFCV